MKQEGENRKAGVKKIKEVEQAKIDAFMKRYKELGHAVQSGIAWKIALENPDVLDINKDPNLCAHKHLRTGIDLTKSDHGALAALLIERGIISQDEYFAFLIDYLEKEKRSYEE